MWRQFQMSELKHSWRDLKMRALLSVKSIVIALGIVLLVSARLRAADALPSNLPIDPWHLTARPWTPVNVSPSDLLDRIENECRFWVQHQASSGAILDPYDNNAEVEYTTPYYTMAVATLLNAGRITTSDPLYASAISAMNHSIADIESSGRSNFFLPAITDALPLFKSMVSASQYNTWNSELSSVFADDAGTNTNNWETYYMKGVWQQAKLGEISTATATSTIESYWTTTQKSRINSSRWNLYHDNSSTPDSLAVEAVGRGNLLALVAEGYNGASAATIKADVLQGSLTALLMQDPSGQGPTGGRTDDHVWGDAGNQDNEQTLALLAQQSGNTWLAGQYQNAALLSFQSASRWARTDSTYGGSFYVTKNQFNPSLRAGYQTASQYSNYNAALMMDTAEAYNTMASAAPITQNPAPTLIGGYAFATDASSSSPNTGFSAAFANAGGMSMELNLRGDTIDPVGNYWNALGVVRFGRPNWDTRLGPSDGQYSTTTPNVGVSFAPTWLESGSWVHLASLPSRYGGTFMTTLATPVLTKVSVVWAPLSGQSGPTFTQNFTITPDGVFSQTTETGGTNTWGMTFPLLKFDGATNLNNSTSNGIASASYPGSTDEEDFILLNTAGAALSSGTSVRSSYGNVTPVQATTSDSTQNTFIYPRGAGDPTAASVKAGFQITANGFTSSLGTVNGSLYVGRTSAGGLGQSIDLNDDGIADVTFASSCTFILQLDDGLVTNVETDRAESAMIQGHLENLVAYTPVSVAVPEPATISILFPVFSMLLVRQRRASNGL
jgi:hypothetical protein